MAITPGAGRRIIQQKFSVACPVCHKEREVSYWSWWDIKKERNSSKCRSCAKTPELREAARKRMLGNTATLGFKHSEATKKLIGDFSRRARPDISGEKAPNWKGGISPINRKIRHSREYLNWRRHVLIRDNHTCQACGIIDVPFHIDHELPFSQFKDLRFEILNGRVLCVPCHRRTPTYKNQTLIYS